MKRKITSLLLIGVFLLAACAPPAEVPVTGDTQTSVVDQVQTAVATLETAVATAVPALETAVATLVPAPEELLNTALENQITVNEILTNPELGTDVGAIRAAALEASPSALVVVASLEAAQAQLDGEPANMVGAALDELNSAVRLVAAIETGDDQQVIQYHQELVTHGAASLGAINLAMNLLGTGPSAPGAGNTLAAADVQVPEGYTAEVLVDDLNFASAITIGPDGTLYVAESGYAYGNIRTPARVLRVVDGGSPEVVAEGFEGPLVGIAVNENTLFASHRGIITAIDLTNNNRTDIVTGLPSQGDHFNENIAVGPDGKIYFTQGVVTNSGVVGLDNYIFGWLPVTPEVHDIPCRDLTLNGTNYTSGNILTPDDVTDSVQTGPYLPFGTAATAGQVVTGDVKCSGAVLRANADGSDLEVYADGFRNPYGLTFHPDGRLFVTENGPDDRGSRPVAGPDNFYEVVQGGWYGWPDYYAGVLVSDPSRTSPGKEPSQPVLENPPALAGEPVAELGEHSASNGFDFSRGDVFATEGTAYIAQFGDLTPVTSAGVVEQSGQMVVTVGPDGTVQPFLTGPDFFRPTDAKFSLEGDVLYVVHFGEVNAVPGGVAPVPGTGALIRITRNP